ncbi:MAG: AzlC family ABC transporter permease [Clostridia bacterium]|nr:AzlC family ABC transporter permease [Clostridia bacterium]
MKGAFVKGLSHGIPIALGYLSVSFGFGIMAVGSDLPVWSAVLISLSNLTSAGQAAGVEIIAAAGTLLEMILTQFIINLRYALMGFSLSQKLDRSFTTPRRLVLSFGITDEVFAVAASQKGKISARYLLGLITLPIVGWTAGTFLGAVAGNLLPQQVADAMGIVLYGMFLAIIIPPAREDRRVLMVVALAAGCSILCKYALPFISGGFAIIISGLVASVVGAVLFPVKEEAAQ